MRHISPGIITQISSVLPTDLHLTDNRYEYYGHVRMQRMCTHMKREDIAVSSVCLVTFSIVPSHHQDKHLIEYTMEKNLLES